VKDGYRRSELEPWAPSPSRNLSQAGKAGCSSLGHTGTPGYLGEALDRLCELDMERHGKWILVVHDSALEGRAVLHRSILLAVAGFKPVGTSEVAQVALCSHGRRFPAVKHT
jgi:hypothetical protein